MRPHGLWSLFRSLLSQGGDIEKDHTDRTYEEYTSRLDAAARERCDCIEWMEVRQAVRDECIRDIAHRLGLTAEQLDAGVITTLVKTLEAVKAAIWDAHYGKGLSIEYVQSVDKEIREAIRPFTQESRDDGDI